MESSETAGWLQAIGSVAAILAAVYVVNEQHRKATEITDAAARDSRANLLFAARTAGGEVMSVVGTMSRNIGARDFGEPAILIYCSAHLRDILDSANLMPIWQMGAKESAARTTIRKVARGLLAEMRLIMSEQMPTTGGQNQG